MEPFQLTPPPPKLLDQIRHKLRIKHYSIRTEQQYIHWARRFILFHNKRHPRDMGPAEVTAFLTDLAVNGHVAAATQNQALSALLFLHREILEFNLPWLDDVVRAKRPARLPVVLTRHEVTAILHAMTGTHGLLARLLYGTGMRLMESIRLRVKDVEFSRLEIIVRDGKGAKDRITMLPQILVEPLQAHLQWRRILFQNDLAKGMASVYLPHALERKYLHASTDWGWQYIFPFGHADVATTMIYTHVLNKGGRGVISPLDAAN